MRYTVNEMIKKGLCFLKSYGAKEFFVRLKEKTEKENITYEQWKKKHRLTKAELAAQRHENDVFQHPSPLGVVLYTHRAYEPGVNQIVFVWVHAFHRKRIRTNRYGIGEIGVLEPVKIIGDALAVRGQRKILQNPGDASRRCLAGIVVEQIFQRVLEHLYARHDMTLDDVPVENGIDISLEH